MTTTLQEKVLNMSSEAVVKFLSCADYDFEGDMRCPSQCMTFRPVYYEDKKTKRYGTEKTPMYLLEGFMRGHSAQRISYILFMHIDPVRKSRIVTLCGNPSCINPYHMEVEEDGTEEKDDDIGQIS
jgi:hypothetical protein